MNGIKKLAVIVFALPLTLTAQADIINGSFEEGLTGWNTLGYTDTRNAVGAFLPTDGTGQAELDNAAFSNVDDEIISAALGLPLLTLVDPFWPENHLRPIMNTTVFETLRQDFEGGLYGCFARADDCLTEGSAAIYQTFDVVDGQTLSFDWNFLGSNYSGINSLGAYAAFVTLSTPDFLAAILLADNQGNGLASVDPSFGNFDALCEVAPKPEYECDNRYNDHFKTFVGGATGYQSTSIDIHGTGPATLGFSLIAATAPYELHGLLVDNVRLSPIAVPEPGSIALLVIGLFGIGLVKRKTA